MRAPAGWLRPGPRGVPWLILAAAAVWWTVVWAALEPSVLGRVPLLDEQYYLHRAALIADSGPLPDEAFIMSPLYPYLVAATGSAGVPDEFGVLPRSPLGIRLLQILAWTATAWLLWATARRILADWDLEQRPTAGWALVPPLLFVLYRPASIYTLTVLLEVPFTFLVTALLYQLSGWGRGAGLAASGALRVDGKAALRSGLVAGILIGLATLLRSHALLLLLPGWLALFGPAAAARSGDRRGDHRDDRHGDPHGDQRARRHHERRLRLRVALLMTVTALLVVTPAVLHNSHQAGRLAGISLNGGLNLYLGLSPPAGGLFVTPAGMNAENDPAGIAYLSEELGVALTGPAAAEDIWAQRAWQSIRENPGRIPGLWLKKIWLHLQGWEIAQITPLSAWPRASWPLRALVVPYSLLATLGLTGLVLLGWRVVPLRPWLLALVLLVAGQSVFFVVSRYRLVIVPMLCLGAGLGLAALAATWRSNGVVISATAAGSSPPRIRPHHYLLVMVLAGLVVWPWSLKTERDLWVQLERENEAVRWGRWALRAESTAVERQNSLERAAQLYRQSIAADATRWPPYRALSRVLAAADSNAAAVRVLDEGVLYTLQPDPLRREAILLLLQTGRQGEAIDRIPAYLRDHPADPDMLHNYAVLLSQTGRLPLALEVAGRLRDLVPTDPRGYIDLGILLARSGDQAAAERVFSEGLRRFPDNTQLAHNLARLRSP